MSLAPQEVEKRALIERLRTDLFALPVIRAQQARLDAFIDSFEREHAAAQPQKHHNGST